jgi:hypothetical protein
VQGALSNGLNSIYIQGQNVDLIKTFVHKLYKMSQSGSIDEFDTEFFWVYDTDVRSGTFSVSPSEDVFAMIRKESDDITLFVMNATTGSNHAQMRVSGIKWTNTCVLTIGASQYIFFTAFDSSNNNFIWRYVVNTSGTKCKYYSNKNILSMLHILGSNIYYILQRNSGGDYRLNFRMANFDSPGEVAASEILWPQSSGWIQSPPANSLIASNGIIFNAISQYNNNKTICFINFKSSDFTLVNTIKTYELGKNGDY